MKPRVDLAGLATFLRRLYPREAVANVAADTGISARTVEAWLDRKSAPRLHHFLVLAHVYGPDLVAAAWHGAPWWLDSARRDARAADLDAELARLQRERADLDRIRART